MLRHDKAIELLNNKDSIKIYIVEGNIFLFAQDVGCWRFSVSSIPLKLMYLHAAVELRQCLLMRWMGRTP